jgi:hypothetical protein
MALFGQGLPATLAPPYRPSYYFQPLSQGGVGTSNVFGNGNLRLAPWHNPRTVTIDRMGGEVTVVGDVGSKVRFVIYGNHASYFWPGDLVLDAGQINGDSVAVQDTPFTGPLTLPPGVYWIGGVIQSVTTTQPTVRTNSNLWPLMPIPLVTTIPGSNFQTACVITGSVTGTPPASFPSTASHGTQFAKPHFRAA